ncbi:MAG TPA: hypothetical protein VK569_09220 [Bacteroidota bacterium]|nr:hypothetical protein [Bacteroidota bacterium]
MVIDINSVVRYIVSLLLFPTFFQSDLLLFAWGGEDTLWVMAAKRLFLLLPVFAFIGACWLTVPSMLTLIVRSNRKEFVTSLFVTWWDFGKAIVSFWGGIFKFVLQCIGSAVGLLKIIVLGIWSIVLEIISLPFRLLRSAGEGMVSSGVPWIAVFLTMFWCLIEALVFTYVTTPLVSDTLSNISGEQLSAGTIRIPLFLFLLFVVLGSYAVLSNFVNAIRSRNVVGIVTISVIELVVLSVEVMFLYREFVDSLVPWFAQYSQGFELGMFWTIGIACLTWFGVRSISWFLFAGAGTPIILSIIQGKGLGPKPVQETEEKRSTLFSAHFVASIKEEAAWVRTKGDDLLAAFILPPLQIVAATVNFCTLLVNGRHLFDLPFTSVYAILSSKSMLESVGAKREAGQLTGTSA